MSARIPKPDKTPPMPKMRKLYLCDPNKNKLCTKESCYWLGQGECKETSCREYSFDDIKTHEVEVIKERRDYTPYCATGIALLAAILTRLLINH